MLGLLDLARTHGLLVLTDEIYDQILYDGAVHSWPPRSRQTCWC